MPKIQEKKIGLKKSKIHEKEKKIQKNLQMKVQIKYFKSEIYKIPKDQENKYR